MIDDNSITTVLNDGHLIHVEKSEWQLSARASILDGIDGPELSDSEQNTKWYEKARKIRREPTVAFVRSAMIAPMIQAGFSSENMLDEACKTFIDDVLLPHIPKLVKNTATSLIDYGWAVFEKIFQIENDMSTSIRKLKHLLPDDTDILVDKRTGDFAGIHQDMLDERNDVTIGREKLLLFSYNVEGTNWYGEPLLRNIEKEYDARQATQDASLRHDKKIAGSHWKIEYPRGTTLVDGAEIDNFELAQRIRGSLQSSGAIIVPRNVQQVIEDLNDELGTDSAWHIELITAGGDPSASYVTKLEYYDKLYVRGLLFPERALLEGQHGTKAEAETHTDIALANISDMLEGILEVINRDLLRPLLQLNFGSGMDNCKIVANPLIDSHKMQLRTLYERLLVDSNILLEEAGHIDMAAIRQQLDIPEVEVESMVFPVETLPVETLPIDIPPTVGISDNPELEDSLSVVPI